jgi:uncharacterized protein (DUF2141 family)
MKYLMKFSVILPFVIIISSYSVKSPVATYSISIDITNIRNTKGTIQLEVFRSQKEFAAETAYKTYLISKKDVSGKTISYVITGLPPGTYGLALLDDENENKKMDYSWGYPKEGFGFSDYYHTGWSKPTFEDFKLDINGDKAVAMKIRYM